MLKLARCFLDIAHWGRIIMASERDTSTLPLPASIGGDAAAAQADRFEAVHAALKGTVYDINSINHTHLQHLESVAAKANHGTIEHNSYVAKAQSALNVPVTSTPESIFPESFAELAASSKPEDIEQCAAVAPPLGTITKRDAAHIMSLAAKAHGGIIQRHCFASLAEAAAAANEAAHSRPPEQMEQSRIVPDVVGGDAVAAQAEHFEAVAAALKDTPYDLASITRGSLSDLKSAAARANNGAVEQDSYVARAQVTAATTLLCYDNLVFQSLLTLV
jgi:hypothetical protein